MTWLEQVAQRLLDVVAASAGAARGLGLLLQVKPSWEQRLAAGIVVNFTKCWGPQRGMTTRASKE